MKKNFFQTLLVLALLFITGITSNTASACPAPDGGLGWITNEATFTYSRPDGSCRATVHYTVCMRGTSQSNLETFIDSIVLSDLECGNPESFDTPELIDGIIKNLVSQAFWADKYGITEIPFFPNTIYPIIYDKICHTGWMPSPENSREFIMQRCDNIPRRCAENIKLFCDRNTLQLVVYRTVPLNDECPLDCSAECGEVNRMW